MGKMEIQMQANVDDDNHRHGNQAKEEEDDDEVMRFVGDGSKDNRGSIPLRSSTGVWRASFFVFAVEFSENLSYFGISKNLITYLTKVMGQDLGTAAMNVNFWAGATTVLSLLGGFLGDSYVGRFHLAFLSSLVYLLGLGLLTMTQYVPSLKPCPTNEGCLQARKSHVVTFFAAAYLAAVAIGGFRPCLASFGADQFDSSHSRERKQKMSYFNWWNVILSLGLILGVTVIAYVEDNDGWGVGFLTLTVAMALSVAIFYLGRPFYRYQEAVHRSLFTPMLQVLVAAFAKRHLPHPWNPALLYEVSDVDGSHGTRLCHTKRLRFLDKAAIEEELPSQQKHDPWKTATITQVEELKLLLCMIPIWLTSMTVGINSSQSNTFFIKQGNAMNRRISAHFEIPPASMDALTSIGMVLTISIYDRVILPVLRKLTGTERGIAILKRAGIGMSITMFSMVVAALVERKRLRANATLSIAWLVPQFLILGVGQGFEYVGLQEYFYEEMPDSMRSLGMAMFLSVLGIGKFLSSLVIKIVEKTTNKGGNGGWIGKDVNESRLDLFYGMLATFDGISLVVFVLYARKYSYKSVRKSSAVVESR